MDAFFTWLDNLSNFWTITIVAVGVLIVYIIDKTTED